MKDNIIYVRITPEIYETLKEEAIQGDTTISDLAREAIVKYILKDAGPWPEEDVALFIAENVAIQDIQLFISKLLEYRRASQNKDIFLWLAAYAYARHKLGHEPTGHEITRIARELDLLDIE